MTEYQDYFAYLLGYFHGQNASAQYKKAVQDNDKQIAKGSLDFVKDYMDHLNDKISGKGKKH
ncbi:MAG: hypothetical protein H7256_11435 [Bdellovibrio sp.]|nr:hypothetical protein [Bdellovibrio sp.]